MTKETIYWDADVWAKFNQENLDARKEEWRYIEHNIKALSSTMLEGKYLLAHKKLFFKGEISPDLFVEFGGREFHYVLALFVLWYHPDLDEAAINRVIDWHCDSYKNALNVSKIREVIDLACMQYWSSFHDDYGFMGGKEEQVVRAFWGAGTDGAKFDKVTDPKRPNLTTRRELLGSRAVRFFWGGMMVALIQGDRAKHYPGRYLREYAFLEMPRIDETSEYTIEVVASNCLFFDESPKVKKDSHVAQECRDSVLADYTKKRYPKNVLEVWDRVTEGKVNFGT